MVTKVSPTESPAEALVSKSHSLFRQGVIVFMIAEDETVQRCVMTVAKDRFATFLLISKLKEKKGFMRAKKSETVAKTTGDFHQQVTEIGAIDHIQRGSSILSDFFAASDNSETQTQSTKETTLPLFDQNKCFYITISGEYFNFVAPSLQDREDIVWALKLFQTSRVTPTDDVQLLRYVWVDVDKDKSNTIDVEEFHHLLERININMKKAELTSKYKKFCATQSFNKGRKGLTFDQSVLFLHKMKRDLWQFKPVNHVWNELFGKTSQTVSAHTFLRKFLREAQGEKEATIEHVHELFATLNQMDTARGESDSILDRPQNNSIDKFHFEVYLASKANDAFDPKRGSLAKAAMSEPLSHYFINSTHNTYVGGGQQPSKFSLDLYRSALSRGTRCLEISVWDAESSGASSVNSSGSSSDKELVPIVYHGPTTISRITFAGVVETVKEFIESNPQAYPIILSLENHCSIPYQESVAKILVCDLGDLLYVPGDETDLPSPESIKGKVVIRGKRQDVQRKKGHSKISPELAKITLLHGARFNNWDKSTSNAHYKMHSFSDTQIKKILKRRQHESCLLYNQNHMTRTYPAEASAIAGNYNPVIAWSMGCQLVALNTQNIDSNLLVNDGFFRQNGSCGYVPKSKEWLDKSLDALRSDRPLSVSIGVLGASCLPKPNGAKQGKCIDPYVKVTLYDVDNLEKDAVVETKVTATVNGNGYFPVWNDDFDFMVKNESSAVLLFTVHDVEVGNERLIASSAIPFRCLRKGYRSVQLFDSSGTRNGAYQFASLLIEVDITPFVQVRDLSQFDSFSVCGISTT